VRLQLVVIHPAHILVVAQVLSRLTIYVAVIALLLPLRLGLLLLSRLLLSLRLGLLLLSGLRLRLLLLLLWLNRLYVAVFKFTLNTTKLPFLFLAAAVVEFALQDLLALQQLLN
jgi:hypothetical protein